ncbi:MAG TPA: arsenate reductase ArsC [Caulobacteraceae bacterium]|jgi:protein-tyrosine-phosphatase
MTHPPLDVLFLCTGNSARSILAEAILNRVGRGRFRACSAGPMPTGKVNPHALSLLKSLGYPVEGLRSKSWDEFAADGASPFDFIITVCDNAAGEVCPIWPGQPMRAHWGIADPAKAEGNEAQVALAFAEAYRILNNRIGLFVSLPMDKLDALSLKRRVDEIGEAVNASRSA